MEGRMAHISVGVVAFVLLLLLSILCVVALIACWAIVAPESVNQEITPGGKMILRAKYLFTAAIGFIPIYLLLDVFVKNPTSPSNDLWVWNDHPHVLVLLLMLSSGLSMAASYYAFQSRGEGRWVLCVGAPCMASLSLIGAIWLSLPM
jgi:hypothetical protein